RAVALCRRDGGAASRPRRLARYRPASLPPDRLDRPSNADRVACSILRIAGVRLPTPLAFPIFLALGALGCQPNAPIRNLAGACAASDGNAANCASHSLEEHRVRDHPDQSFLLGFVEFDDQGQPYIRDQITTL